MTAETLRRAAALTVAVVGAACAGLALHVDRVAKRDDRADLPRGLFDLAGQTFAVEPYTDLFVDRAEAAGDALLSVNATRRMWEEARCVRHRRRAEIARLTRWVPPKVRVLARIPTAPTAPYLVRIDGARVSGCREHPAVDLRSVSNVVVQNGWFL